ncbi:hypothetical protein [Arthrobacter sp. H5]|uniref:hypothetical protein n=1 Tax=Arthrobacter sp. H5 TaxID=1267973 RepID=UPI0004BB4F8E|nr:hypothetical protein [Arthrobacter sp. H5]
MEPTRSDNMPAPDLFPWPRPVSPGVLKIGKKVLGIVMVLVVLAQLVPLQQIGGMMNHLFTIVLLLSWLGPARRYLSRFLDRRSGESKSD